MGSETKYFIYGGGRWREVDVDSGRIAGWGRARFLVSRRRKVAAVRREAVLAALRALALGQPTVARDGPQLPYKYKEKYHKDRIESAKPCQHCQCCHLTKSNGNVTKEKPVTVQSRTHSNLQIASTSRKINSASTNGIKEATKSKRKRSSSSEGGRKKRRKSSELRKRETSSSDKSSSGEHFQTKVVTTATVHMKDSNTRSTSVLKSPSFKPRNMHISPRKVQISPRKVLRRSSSSEIKWYEESSKKKISQPGFKTGPKSPRKQKGSSDEKISSLHKASPRKRKRSTSREESPKLNSGKTMNKSKYLRPKSKRVKDSSSDESVPKRLTRQNVSLVISSEDSDKKTNAVTKKPGPRRFRNSNKIIQNLGTKSGPSGFRELVIEEKDVEILRLYLQKHCTDEELLKFDMYDKYKKEQFHRITPLVHIEHCPQITRMLRDSQESQITLVDFASKLGLQSKSDVTSQPRYKIRKKKKRVSLEKENLKPVRVNRITDEKLESIINMKQRKQKEKDDTELSSDGDSDGSENKQVQKSQGKKPEVKKTKPAPGVKKPEVKKPAILTKRRIFKEYSCLEDHAIVTWVSVGGRATSVNGNKLWRQLQETFPRLTGQARTWHSLRNRYLRYILPQLGALSLPPGDQARLRAAAATGELKAHKKTSRNSIFELPPRGAFSRPPRVNLGTTSTPAKEAHDVPGPSTRSQRVSPSAGSQTPSPRRRAPRTPRAATPRYSDLTRQFTAKHLARQRSSDGSNISARKSDLKRKKTKKDSSSDNSDQSNSDSESDRRNNRNSNRSNSANSDGSIRRKWNSRSQAHDSNSDTDLRVKSSRNKSTKNKSPKTGSLSERDRRQSNRKNTRESNRKESPESSDSSRVGGKSEHKPRKKSVRDKSESNSDSESDNESLRHRSNRKMSPKSAKESTRNQSPETISDSDISNVRRNYEWRRKSNRNKSPDKSNSERDSSEAFETSRRKSKNTNGKSNANKSPRTKNMSRSESYSKRNLHKQSQRNKSHELNGNQSSRNKLPDISFSESSVSSERPIVRRSPRKPIPRESLNESKSNKKTRLSKTNIDKNVTRLSLRKDSKNQESPPKLLRSPTKGQRRTRRLFNPKAEL